MPKNSAQEGKGAFAEADARLSAMHGYAPVFVFREFMLGPRERVLRTAFARVRRDVWHARESRLRATWESYG